MPKVIVKYYKLSYPDSASGLHLRTRWHMVTAEFLQKTGKSNHFYCNLGWAI